MSARDTVVQQVNAVGEIKIEVDTIKEEIDIDKNYINDKKLEIENIIDTGITITYKHVEIKQDLFPELRLF